MRPDEYRWVASLDAETSQQNARHAPRCRWRFRALAPYPAEYRAALAQWHRDCAASRAHASAHPARLYQLSTALVQPCAMLLLLGLLLRSVEHTPELQSLMRLLYDVFCLKKKN